MWSLIFYETNYNYAKPRFSAQVTSFETLWLNQPSRRWGVLYVACKRSILVALNQICCGVCLFKCFDLSLCWGGTECTHSPKSQRGQFQLQQIIFWFFWGSSYTGVKWCPKEPINCRDPFWPIQFTAVTQFQRCQKLQRDMNKLLQPPKPVHNDVFVK